MIRTQSSCELAFRLAPVSRCLWVAAAILCADETPATAEERPGNSTGYMAKMAKQSNALTDHTDAKNDERWQVDSEHIFGFAHGTDIGKRGELEFEFEPVGALGKREGRYFATSHAAFLKYTIADSFRLAPAVLFMTHDIRDVPDFDDRRQVAFGGGILEMRYRVLDREKAPLRIDVQFRTRRESDR
jgi:hypothetical protein